MLSRLEQVFGGRLSESVDASPAPAPSSCGRAVRSDAAAQVFEAVCRHDPPLPEGEGVDALSEIAEDVDRYCINERCDIVSPGEAYADWVSLPSGTVGEFCAMERLGAERQKTYADIRKVPVPPAAAKEMEELTGAYVGFSPEQYLLLIRRMLQIGMVD